MRNPNSLEAIIGYMARRIWMDMRRNKQTEKLAPIIATMRRGIQSAQNAKSPVTPSRPETPSLYSKTRLHYRGLSGTGFWGSLNKI